MATNLPSLAPSVLILWRGRWHLIGPHWLAERERIGLTPIDCEIIALARYRGALSVAGRLMSGGLRDE